MRIGAVHVDHQTGPGRYGNPNGVGNRPDHKAGRSRGSVGLTNVVIDGSNNGTTSRDLTILNTGTSSASGIAVSRVGTGIGTSNTTIKNVNISTGVATSLGYGISVGGVGAGTSGADNDNVTIQNNVITNAPIGIYATGTTSSSTGGDDNLMISGNSIDYNNTVGTTLTPLGMQLGNVLTSTVSGNTVSVQTGTSTQPVGISLETGFVSSTLNANKITAALTTATGGYGGRGITIGTGTASSALLLSNNVIYGVNGSNFSGFSNSSSMGIAIGMVGSSTTITTVAGGINLYFNSVNMFGNHSYTSATNTTALYVVLVRSALNIRNNIFSNSLNNTTTSGSKNYCVYSAAAASGSTDINYNDYYPVSPSANSTGFVGFIASADQATLAAWATRNRQLTQPISGDPKFISNTNLHITSVP